MKFWLKDLRGSGNMENCLQALSDSGIRTETTAPSAICAGPIMSNKESMIGAQKRANQPNKKNIEQQFKMSCETIIFDRDSESRLRNTTRCMSAKMASVQFAVTRKQPSATANCVRSPSIIATRQTKSVASYVGTAIR